MLVIFLFVHVILKLRRSMLLYPINFVAVDRISGTTRFRAVLTGTVIKKLSFESLFIESSVYRGYLLNQCC